MPRARCGLLAACSSSPSVTAREGSMGSVRLSLHRAHVAGKGPNPYIGRRIFPGDPMGITAPAPATSEKSLFSDMLDVFNVLHDPIAVFNRIKERPRILAPWIVLSIAFVVITILTRPYQQAAMDAFKTTLSPEQAARMGSRGAGGGVVGLVLTPVGVLAALAIGAGVVWMAVAITGAQARYKTVFSVLAFSCVTYVLFAVIGIVVLTVRGKQAIEIGRASCRERV